MTPIARRQLLIAGAGAGMAGLTFAAEPRRTLFDLDRQRLGQLIPARVGDRSGLDDPSVVPESVDASPEASETLSRSYGDGGDTRPIMLLLAYHAPRSHELKVHRPETCYTVAGFQVANLRPLVVPFRAGGSVPGVTFEARRGERVETVLYWTRVGAAFPVSLTSQRLAFLKQAIEGVRADGLLVRISVIMKDVGSAPRLLSQFGAELIQSSDVQARRLLVGAALSA